MVRSIVITIAIILILQLQNINFTLKHTEIIHFGTIHMVRVLLFYTNTDFLYYIVVVTYPFSLYLICNIPLLRIMCINQIKILWMDNISINCIMVCGWIKDYHQCYSTNHLLTG